MMMMMRTKSLFMVKILQFQRKSERRKYCKLHSKLQCQCNFFLNIFTGFHSTRPHKSKHYFISRELNLFFRGVLERTTHGKSSEWAVIMVDRDWISTRVGHHWTKSVGTLVVDEKIKVWTFYYRIKQVLGRSY